jgi:hypothetical protein
VLLSDGTNVNHALVKDGWCWWYRKYAPFNSELEKSESEARAAKKGLWVDPAPIPPWVYRNARRGQSLDLSDLVPLDNGTRSSGTSRGPPLIGAVEPDSSSPTLPYPIIGNRRSHIYHRPDCPNYSQVAPRNRVEFNSATLSWLRVGGYSIASATEGAGCAGGWASRYAVRAALHAKKRKAASLSLSGTMRGMRGAVVEDMGATSGL